MPRNTMTESVTGRLYDLWAKVYDYTFGALVHARHVRALQELRTRPGDRVLDLGVGTGMTLPCYPDNITVVGMDLSAGMLAKADQKRDEHHLRHVHLCQADAMHPPFAEGSFDHVVITHTVSVVSEPARLMAWARRLVKPDGSIILLNHFRSTNPLIGWFERVFNPLFVKIGWRSDLSLADCLEGVDLHVQYRFKLRYMDLWQIVVLSPQPVTGAARAGAAQAHATPQTQTPPRGMLAVE